MFLDNKLFWLPTTPSVSYKP